DQGHRSGADRENGGYNVEIDQAAGNVDLRKSEMQGQTAEGRSVIAPGDRMPAKRDKVKYLAEGNRRQGKVDPPKLDDQVTDGRSGHRADHNANEKTHGCAGHQKLQRECRSVGTQAEIGRLTERDHARMA